MSKWRRPHSLFSILSDTTPVLLNRKFCQWVHRSNMFYYKRYLNLNFFWTPNGRKYVQYKIEVLFTLEEFVLYPKREDFYLNLSKSSILELYKNLKAHWQRYWKNCHRSTWLCFCLFFLITPAWLGISMCENWSAKKKSQISRESLNHGRIISKVIPEGYILLYSEIGTFSTSQTKGKCY